METRRRGRWPAIQLPARLAAVRATVSSMAFPAPAPYTGASRPTLEESLPASEGSHPHLGGSAAPRPEPVPSAARRTRRPGAVSGPWTGAGPPSGRGAARSPRTLRPRRDGPREEWCSLVRPDLQLSPPFPYVTGLGPPAAAAAKPRGHTVGTGRGLAPVETHSNTNAPASARKSWVGDASAAEGLF